ncbi:LysR family transcriptional regulator [Pyxidicoccus fallax]|uniref:LysR family transcriptional regulator n=1 Tax=Pyxidicoccus fallax TaxID=394095 RepID=A0A848LAL4_9BACT|nr:LysR substrate-binding domain-containing protein [Pyxidicoccus fallax]NMO15554.1 LysR family transcriptional regulator [Pyxidicoccus fallax]NPC82544.1 LysR family transcriptional regulator [Pyxidicoccus fallax]
MSRPSLYALQGFVAAARHGNLSHAARSLHLTVSALSHQIRGLEDQLGQRLFVRNARGVELTADGRRLFERVAEHLDAIEHAMRPFRARRDEVLTLTLLPSFATSWLVPRLPRFVALHPQLEINLHSSAELVDFDRATDIDAGVRFGRGYWPGLRAVHLFDDQVTPSASPALLERLGRPTLQTLDRFPLLGSPNSWREWFERHGGTLPRRFVANFDDSETLHRAAVEGLGIALGRVTLIRPLVQAGLLVPLFTESLKADYAHYLVYPARSDDHTGLAAFREWLLAEARDYVALDSPPAVPVRDAEVKRGGRRKRTRG